MVVCFAESADCVIHFTSAVKGALCVFVPRRRDPGSGSMCELRWSRSSPPPQEYGVAFLICSEVSQRPMVLALAAGTQSHFLGLLACTLVLNQTSGNKEKL